LSTETVFDATEEFLDDLVYNDVDALEALVNKYGASERTHGAIGEKGVKAISTKVFQAYKNKHGVGEGADLDEGAGSHDDSLGETDEERLERYRGMASAAHGVGATLDGNEYDRVAELLAKKMSEGKKADELALILEQMRTPFDYMDEPVPDPAYDEEGYEFDTNEWGDGSDPVPTTNTPGKQKIEDQMVDDMVGHMIMHKDQHGTSVNSWDATSLIYDFDYEYDISHMDEDDIAVANSAIDRAKEEAGEFIEEPMQQESTRWQEIARVKSNK